MNIDKYYKNVSSDAKKHLLEECRKRHIPYRKMWNSHRHSFFSDKIGDFGGKDISEFETNLFVFDFAIIWFSNYATLLLSSFLEMDEDNRNDQHNVMNYISWRICSDLAAVRRLILVGLDVQAKQIVRSVSENIDALGVAAKNPEFARKFIEHQDIEKNKLVWFKYIAKGKAKKSIYKELSDLIKNDFDSMINYREEEEAVLSAAAHPSLVSGFFSVMPHFLDSEDSDHVGINSVIASNSNRTLRYCSVRVFEHCMYDQVLYKSYERFCACPSKVWDSRISGEIKRTVQSGRELGFILYYFLANQSELMTLRRKDQSGAAT